MNTCSEIDLDSPAIKTLGSLFKLTEVYLRDDGFQSDDQQVSSHPKYIRFKYDDDDDDDDDDVKDDSTITICLNSSVETSEESVLMEDGDLFQEMSALGLPLSFQTSKQQSSGQPKVRLKAKQHKGDNCQTMVKDQVLVSQNGNTENMFHEDLQDNSINTSAMSLLDQAVHSCSGSDVSDDTVSLSNTSIEKLVNVAVETRCGDLIKPMDEPIPKYISSESLIDDMLKTDFQTETERVSMDASSDCLEENPKEVDVKLVDEIETKALELGSSAMQLEDHGLGTHSLKTEIETPEDSQMIVDNDSTDTSFDATCVEWSAFWDSYYMRYYFYNTKTQESTWCPPPGMESFTSADNSNVCDESYAEVIGTKANPIHSHNEKQHLDINDQTGDTVHSAKQLTTENLSVGPVMILDTPCVLDANGEDENSSSTFNGGVITQLSDSSCLSNTIEAEACDDDLHHNELHMDELETVADDLCSQKTAAATKKKKRRKNRRKKSFSNNDNHEVQPVEDYYVDITKYWCQRYLLFSKFDDGIQMDEEGWFSVTPEAIARHHASRIGGGIVADCFAGVGGNIIQFAETSIHVIAIDIDPNKIDYAHNNAAIYGVEDKIEFINGDCISLAPNLKADTIFLSPPWGGPDYIKVESYDLSMLQPYDGQFLFNAFKVNASLIIMFLPKNVDIAQLAELSLSSDTPWSLEVEKNFLNGKLKAVTAYFSKIS